MAGPGNFDVRLERLDGALVVSPHGEIDLATVGLVREAVERELSDGEALALDLRGVGFMDTSGLRYVLELHGRAERGELELRLVRGAGAVQRVFEVAGLDVRLPFVEGPMDRPAN